MTFDADLLKSQGIYMTVTLIAVAFLGCVVVMAFQNRRRLNALHEVQLIDATLAEQELLMNKLAKRLHVRAIPRIGTTRRSISILSRNSQEPETIQEWNRVDQILKEIGAELRQFCHSLDGELVAFKDFNTDLRSLVADYKSDDDLRFHFKHDETEIGFSKDKTLAILRIVQEALNNSLKHAAAANVTVEVITKRKRVFLKVMDDGLGFDQQTIEDRRSIGMDYMRVRAKRWDCKFSIESSPGLGTTVCLQIPLT